MRYGTWGSPRSQGTPISLVNTEKELNSVSISVLLTYIYTFVPVTDRFLAGAALLRGPSENLFYHSGHETWDFTILDSDRYGYYTREVDQYLDGVLTQILLLPWADTDFDRFLLLRPPISTLPETSAGRVKAKLGWVLLDERHHHKIFVCS